MTTEHYTKQEQPYLNPVSLYAQYKMEGAKPKEKIWLLEGFVDAIEVANASFREDTDLGEDEEYLKLLEEVLIKTNKLNKKEK